MFTRRIFDRFRRGERGTVLVLVAMAIAVFLGFVALSFDFGRAGATQSELQSFADNVALAGAGELDGGNNSIARATAAMQELIADSQSFGLGGRDLDLNDFTFTFHTALPADDLSSMDSTVTNVDAEAAFVRVVVDPHTVDMPFASVLSVTLGGGGMEANLSAVAVAGFTMYACDVTPMMFCLPSGYDADDHIGDMMLLRSGGGGGAWQPGNFGFVDLSEAGIDDLGPCDGLSGQNLSRCLLGAEDFLTKCFAQTGIDTKPGQNVGSYEAAINVRFDMYQATMNGKKNDEDYRPAPNVVKGVVPSSGSCVGNNPTDSPSEPLPQDNCFIDNTCATVGDGPRFGDGNWDRSGYVTANHGVDPTTGAPSYPPGTGSQSTRYSMYLAELAQALGVDAPAELSGPEPDFSGDVYKQYLVDLILADDANAILTDPALVETGRPTCSSHRSPNPERRVMVLAGVDCTENPISGAASDVPVKEFVKIFLTQPAGADPADTSNFNIWGEVIGTTSDSTSGLFREVVQLYR